MREQLIQTSSIFSNNKNEESIGNAQLEIPLEEQELLEDIDLCRVIKLETENRDLSLKLEEVYPDSLFCVLYDTNNSANFVGHIKEEIIFEVPIADYEVIVVGSKLVVLRVELLVQNDNPEVKYMVLEGDNYKLIDEVTVELKGEDFVFNGTTYSRKTTEIKPVKVSADGNSKTYFYSDSNFVHKGVDTLILQDSQVNNLLMADANGSYLGYYLPLNQDGTINLQGRRFETLSRFTLTLMALRDVSTGADYLLSCSTQILLGVGDFQHSSYKSIPVTNGVAILMSTASAEKTLNVFTPNHQKIILEPKYKIRDNAVLNGLYFEKDNVLLLDNGSLIFTEKLTKRTILVKGKEVAMPTTYLGGL